MLTLNCYVPLKLRLSGEPTEDDWLRLEQVLAAQYSRAFERSLAEAGRVYRLLPGSREAVREPFDLARLSHARYGLPSYDDGGKAVRVQVKSGTPASTDPLEEDWQAELDEAARLSHEEGASLSVRVFNIRLAVLLSFRPEVFKDEDEVIAFIERCHELAASESKTLKALADQAPTLLDVNGEGFPNTWADKVRKDFPSGVNLDELYRTYQSKRKDALSIATSIAPEVWARGLPFSLNEARHVDERDDFPKLYAHLPIRGTPGEVTYNYGRALFWWSQANDHYSFVKNYEKDVEVASNLLRRGEVIGDRDLYEKMHKSFEDFRGDLEHFKGGAIHVLGYRGFKWVVITDAEGGYLIPTEGADAFSNQIREVDRRIAGTGFNDCLSRAFTWAFERDYFDDAGLEVWEGIKENGWKMLFTAVAIFGVQFVPGLNVAVDIVLIIEFGFDVLSTVADLKTALTDAGSPKSVVDMQRASAQLAQTLVGTGAKVMLWAISWSAGKLTHKVATYRQGKKFIDEHGDTPEVRKALGDARGDIAKAERNLAAERERLAAEQRRRAAEAERTRTQEEEKRQAEEAERRRSEEEEKPQAAEAERKREEEKLKAKETAAKKPSRTLAEIEQELKNQGLTSADIRRFSGGKRLSAAVAERAARLLEHFTPDDVKKLGEFLSQHKIALSDDLVNAFIQKVPRGKMGEYVRHLDIVSEISQATKSPGWSAEKPTLEETTTIHPGKPPRTSEFVETPGSKVLRENLIKRLGEEPPPGYHAHHIIPEKEFGSGLDWMRERLRQAGSNINEADNGVFLAGSRSTANPDLTRLHNSYIHAGRQKEYAYTLTRRLADLHGAKFLQEVRAIGEEMRTGKFKIDEIPHGWKGKWQPGQWAPVEPGFEPGWIEE